jgi:hypothetical protein
MGIFDNLKKQPAPTPAAKPTKMIALALEDRAFFEKLCAEKAIRYKVELASDGLYEYTFDADRYPEISEYFSPVPKDEPEEKPAPPPEPPKQSSVDALIGNATGRSTGRPEIPDNPLTRATAAAVRGELTPPSYLEKMGLAGQPAASAPTEREKRWAEEKLTEELKEIEAEIEEADALLASSQEPAAEAAGKQRRKRKSKGRTNQIMTRLTDAELTQFHRRVKKSGLAQGEYLRSVALTGKVVIEERSMADVALLDELAIIRAELGRQGGLLKMVIKPNEGQRELAPAEWAALIQAVRDMENMKKRLSDLEVKVTHGNSDPQNEQKRPVR